MIIIFGQNSFTNCWTFYRYFHFYYCVVSHVLGQTKKIFHAKTEWWLLIMVATARPRNTKNCTHFSMRTGMLQIINTAVCICQSVCPKLQINWSTNTTVTSTSITITTTRHENFAFTFLKHNYQMSKRSSKWAVNSQYMWQRSSCKIWTLTPSTNSMKKVTFL